MGRADDPALVGLRFGDFGGALIVTVYNDGKIVGFEVASRSNSSRFLDMTSSLMGWAMGVGDSDP